MKLKMAHFARAVPVGDDMREQVYAERHNVTMLVERTSGGTEYVRLGRFCYPMAQLQSWEPEDEPVKSK